MQNNIYLNGFQAFIKKKVIIFDENLVLTK
ncbi:hypothetical protein FLJU110815_07235 [Flavobacterium jumunjinense]|jgi:hypothetical protein